MGKIVFILNICQISHSSFTVSYFNFLLLLNLDIDNKDFTFEFMKNKLFLSLFLAASLLQAQNTKKASEAIKELKSGVLVVNLIHPTKKIEALLRGGKKEESLALESQVAAEHARMIAAFKAKYNFSSLLFMYSFDAGKLADGDASVLFNADGMAQDSMPVHYYFVELTLSEEKNLSGLIVKNDQRDNLEKPFPYFISLYKGMGFGKRSIEELAEELNRRLTDFYRNSLR